MDFSFPFEAYPIQNEFMSGIHQCLDDDCVGFFESPTGTGKTLSIICGTLSWLEKNKFKKLELKEADTKDLDPLDSHLLKMKMQEKSGEQDKQLEQRERLLKEIMKSGSRNVRHTKRLKSKEEGKKEDNNFLLQDETSMNFDVSSSEEEHGEEEKNVFGEDNGSIKVYYTSRTHSQLSQFCAELKKTKFYTGKPSLQRREDMSEKLELFSTSLSSRAQLCVVDSVRTLSSQSAINDACQLKREDKGGCECNKKDLVKSMALECMGEGIIDIEELFKKGMRDRTCSYYTSRLMMQQCDLVTLPYQMLFHESTRRSLNLSLENCVVIVDEAHNLVDSINQIHSSSITENIVQEASNQLNAYLERYKARLSSQNTIFLLKIQSLLTGLSKLLRQDRDDALISVNQFMFDINCDNLNLFELSTKIKDSKISNKLRGFCNFEKRENPNSFYGVTHFIDSLTNVEGDGRILLKKNKQIDFILLSPEAIVQSFAKQCKSLILCGGTLSPMKTFKTQLFNDEPLKFRYFSYDHVIPPSNLLCVSLGSGPSEACFNFTFAQRKDEKMQRDLIATLQNLRRVCSKGGIVCFFPSYAFQNEFYEFTKKQGSSEKFGKLFVSSNKSDGNVFDNYSKEILNKSGQAMLWSVVGGSLSEGINFSDNLCRIVVMIGVPYPNANDVVLMEKAKRLGGSNYIESLAIRALNQSIGRAIRHINDYSAIVLLDNRYTVENGIVSNIPSWMKKSKHNAKNFGEAIGSIAKFLKEKTPK